MSSPYSQFIRKQQIQRISAESRPLAHTHTDTKALVFDPFADTRQIVLIQECQAIRLQRTSKVHGQITVQLAIFLIDQHSESVVLEIRLFILEGIPKTRN